MVAPRAHAAADLEAVRRGHGHVEDDRARLVAVVDPVERLGAVGGELDLVSLEGQGAPKRFAHGGIVVYN